jgi:N utilization substance protein B
MSNRRQIRESVVQALYAFQVGAHSVEDTLNIFLKPRLATFDDKEGFTFGETLFLKTSRKLDQFDEELQSQVQNWDIERLAILDRIIIKMAFVEFLEFPEIPVKVSINEAIEIAKKYSTEQSGKFINGVLDAVLARWKKEGRIAKSGRGLLDQTIT